MATRSPTPARTLSRALRRLSALVAIVTVAAAFAEVPSFAQALTAPAPYAVRGGDRPTPWVAAYRVVHGVQAPSPGADIDGDGAVDFANPTGKSPRGADAYGEGRFGASRTGHIHAGVDYVSDAGQQVVAPIAGFVTRVGYAYRDSFDYRYVEITNRLTGYTARVMYVGPEVREGQALALGQVIGRAQTLQPRYPNGITDHVHLEIARLDGRQLDAAVLVPVST